MDASERSGKLIRGAGLLTETLTGGGFSLQLDEGGCLDVVSATIFPFRSNFRVPQSPPDHDYPNHSVMDGTFVGLEGIWRA